jgi:hypothetical protein
MIGCADSVVDASPTNVGSWPLAPVHAMSEMGPLVGAERTTSGRRDQYRP